MDRRTLLKTLSAITAGATLSAPAFAAPKLRLKLGTVTATEHPITLAAKDAANAIGTATGNDVSLRIFPNSQLGSDMDMLSQVRSGALDMVVISSVVLSNLVPSTSIVGTGFAWQDYGKVWSAMDGELGTTIKKAIEEKGLYCVGRIWDMGFRQITSSEKRITTPEDLKGFKIRIPPADIWVSLFQSLNASPANITWAETYSALQTRIADGQENPLTPIYFSKMYEVQKYVSMTGHMWDGMWIVVSKERWQKIPADQRALIEKAIDTAGASQRIKSEELNQSLRIELQNKGMTFIDVDRSLFHKHLTNTGYYKKMKEKYNPEIWSAMEKYTGKLA